MREANEKELQNWDQLVADNPDGGEVLQTRVWGEFKGRYGWAPRYFIYELNPKATVVVMFLTRKVKGLGEVWYCPKGPGVASVQQLLQIAKITRLGLVGPFVVKFESELDESDQNLSLLTSKSALLKSSRDVHISRATIRINLEPSTEELMAGIKSKTRYNIRLAQRKGVTVEAVECSRENMKIMYELMIQTQSRAGFMMRSYEYLVDYWTAQSAAGQGQMFIASRDSKVLAGAFVTMLGDKAWYKDGGSRREHNDLMATYLMQWEIMCWLKAKGVKVYDLVGVATRNHRRPQDPLYGLYHFKSGFGGQEAQFIGTWDLPIDAGKYAIWNRIGERLTLGYHHRTKKSFWY